MSIAQYTDTENLQAALDYRQRGFSLVFCDQRSKKPLNKSWQHLQKTPPNEAEIRSWDQAWPGANVAIITGAVSGLVVLDVDGPEGLETIKQKHLPPTPCASTGKGFHYYFKHPDFEIRNFVRKAPGLDLRGDGGYVIAPPSIHASGKHYEWCPGLGLDDVGLAEMPEWLIELVKEPAGNGGKVDADEWSRDVPHGERNSTLAHLAGSLLVKMKPGDALPMLLAWNRAHCNPPLMDAEVQVVVQSIAKAEAEKQKKSSDYTLTDVGNGQRFTAQWGNDVRFNPTQGSWLHFDGTRWVPDAVGKIMQLAKETARKIYEEASYERDDTQRKALVGHATRSESIARLEAMLKAASTEPGIPILPDQLDSDPWVLNVLNGTICLRTGSLLPHKRENLITKKAPVIYDPQAPCPRWTHFLQTIMQSMEKIDFLMRACGYGLTGLTYEQVLFILYGVGANGKSVFCETISYVLGDYALTVPFSTFLVKRGDAIPNDVAMLPGARFVSASEGEQGSRLAESLVKRLTGGDKVSARHLHCEFFEFTPQFKAFLSTNHKPAVRGTDHAMWRRIRLIPFTYTVPESERDLRLLEKLKEESSGILMWLLAGCLKWQRVGLGAPAEVQQATDSYRQEMDAFSDFINECCIVNNAARAPVSDLYKAYSGWAERNGEDVLTRRQLTSQLGERGFKTVQGTHGYYFFQGLGLRATEQ